WFQPDVVVGVGFWGHVPHLVLHPQQFGMKTVPWLVADGYVAAHHEGLNALPLILVTSNWVKEVYIRDGIRGDNIEVLPVGCDTDGFAPRSRDDLKVQSIREALGMSDDQIMILTGGASGHRQEGHLLDQRGLAQFHALLVGCLRYLRCTVAAGGFRNDSCGG